WSGRRAYVVFDAEGKPETREKVDFAAKGLALELIARGALPFIVKIPNLEGREKTGIDDFLATRGPEAALKLFLEAQKTPFGVLILDPSDPMPSARKFVKEF